MLKPILIVFIFCLTVYLIPASPQTGQIDIVKNPLTEIARTSEKIKLTHIRTWGADNDDDPDAETHPAMFFKAPVDIAVDSRQNVYILDLFHCQIIVFDKSGHFIKTIAKKGQGPSDLNMPFNIAIDQKDKIWINDWGNRRIKVFSFEGKSIAVLKTAIGLPTNLAFPAPGHVAFYQYNDAVKGKAIVVSRDMSGKRTGKIGAGMLPPRPRLPWRGGELDTHHITFNRRTGRYYIAYTWSQMVQVFKPDNTFECCIFYDTPMNVAALEWSSQRKNFDHSRKLTKHSECIDIGVNDDGYIFLVATMRQPQKNERTSLVNMMPFPADKDYPETTDMYRLLVFNPNGKIVAAKQLNTYCSEIHIHGNDLFIVDSTFNKVVYQYRYHIEK